jgi:predicted RNA-binding protein Jag
MARAKGNRKQKDTPIEETSTEDIKVEETPKEDVKVEETPVEDVKIEETPEEVVEPDTAPEKDSEPTDEGTPVEIVSGDSEEEKDSEPTDKGTPVEEPKEDTKLEKDSESEINIEDLTVTLDNQGILKLIGTEGKSLDKLRMLLNVAKDNSIKIMAAQLIDISNTDIHKQTDDKVYGVVQTLNSLVKGVISQTEYEDFLVRWELLQMVYADDELEFFSTIPVFSLDYRWTNQRGLKAYKNIQTLLISLSKQETREMNLKSLDLNTVLDIEIIKNEKSIENLKRYYL